MRLQLTGATLLLAVLPGAGAAQERGPRPSSAADAGSLATVTEVPGPPAKRVTGRIRGELSAYSDSDHVDVLTPSISAEAQDSLAGWSAKGQYLLDAVSAASVDIVSTASRHWTELRHVGSAEGTLKPHDLGVTAGGSVSSEPDYLAWAAAGSVSLDLDQKNFVLVAGYSYGHDTIGR